MGKKKKNQNNQPGPGGPALRGVRCGESPAAGRAGGAPRCPRAGGRCTGLRPAGCEAAAREVRPRWGHFFVLYKPCQICPWGKLPRVKRSLNGTRASAPAGPRKAALPRCPYLASRLSSFFFQFSARRTGSVSSVPGGAAPRAGEGFGRRSLPACPRPERRLCGGRRGCHRARR